MTQEKNHDAMPPLGINQRQIPPENPRPENARIEPAYQSNASLGALLRDARQKRGLSPADLAGSLNLDLATVEAIESNRLDEAPEPLYIRAYLKHWAGMMQTDPAPWLAALDAQIVPTAGAHRVSARTPIDTVRQPRAMGRHRRGGIARALWRLLVVIVLIGAAVALIALALPSFWQKVTQWLPEHEQPASMQNTLNLPVTPVPLSTNQPAEHAAPLPPPPSLTLPAAPAAPAIPIASANGEASAQTNPNTVSAPTTPAEPVPPEPSATAPTTEPSPTVASTVSQTKTPPPAAAALSDDLTIAVTAADCWVEVRDATGKRLIYDVLKTGSTRTITGKEPFTVILGHAKGVEVSWKGKPVTLSAPNSTTGVIRTTVGGS